MRKFNPDDYNVSFSVGRTLVGESLAGKLKESITAYYTPPETDEALKKFARMMLYTGYEAGLQATREAEALLRESLMEATLDVPQFPYFDREED